MYPDTMLYINGHWHSASGGATIPVTNPATGDSIGQVARASRSDLDRALGAAETGFRTWRAMPAIDRARILRRAAELLRSRSDRIAAILTLEQGKPLAEATLEVTAGADIIEWFAEEGRRTYGRMIPARAHGVSQLVIKEPVGPVAAFTPWNFPINQAVRKASAALAAGCSVILKGPEETPASCAALIGALADAGVPPGALNLVYGDPAEISEYLIASPVIRKISFTGSTAVGKHLAALAGRNMKRATMELGGHAPAIVFQDADLELALKVLTAQKFRNAGQVCVSPTRFLVHESLFDRFVDGFVEAAQALRVDNGMDPSTQMGPLAHARRVEAMESLVADAQSRGAAIRAGGKRIDRPGYFFAPTVITDPPLDSRLMNEEPFGPIALICRFRDEKDAIAEANRLPYGLAAYAYTRSASKASAVASALETGMVSINHHGLGPVETPFGGVKESGYGSEGGSEAIEPYLVGKFVSQAA
jgi:succinate-semialdehyde dehydrogenase/glutarate-semialdehyde dehydrogenase